MSQAHASPRLVLFEVELGGPEQNRVTTCFRSSEWTGCAVLPAKSTTCGGERLFLTCLCKLTFDFCRAVRYWPR
jgi:hypothetical protein